MTKKTHTRPLPPPLPRAVVESCDGSAVEIDTWRIPTHPDNPPTVGISVWNHPQNSHCDLSYWRGSDLRNLAAAIVAAADWLDAHGERQ